ncbi:MAG: hypothetical protein KDK97_14975 [Verrucomicrobiales bacterium]|nr:hypothetical protein [Verrucomicrobiales bacterium]MCP5556375.1 hypothetical protein [Verrucomicrobiaceae bacterium]
MPLPSLPIWLWAALCLAAMMGGLWLHLVLHPLRQQFSHALDILRLHPRLLALGFVAFLSAMLWGGDDPRMPGGRALADWVDWSALLGPLALESGGHFALMLHQVDPLWPLALLLPVALILQAWRIQALPFRYGEGRTGAGMRSFLLWGLAALSCGWVVLEALNLRQFLPEWVHSVQSLLRALGVALAAAGVQVWIIRLVEEWQMPTRTETAKDQATALDAVFARWRGVLVLGGFNALWMALFDWAQDSNLRLAPALVLEPLLFFAPLPIAVACEDGLGLPEIGAQALRLMARAFWALLGLAITSLVLIMLLRYTVGTLTALVAGQGVAAKLGIQIVAAFSLATVHNWLFLAVALTLVQRFPRQTADSTSPDPAPQSS